MNFCCQRIFLFHLRQWRGHIPAPHSADKVQDLRLKGGKGDHAVQPTGKALDAPQNPPELLQVLRIDLAAVLPYTGAEMVWIPVVVVPFLYVTGPENDFYDLITRRRGPHVCVKCQCPLDQRPLDLNGETLVIGRGPQFHRQHVQDILRHGGHGGVNMHPVRVGAQLFDLPPQGIGKSLGFQLAGQVLRHNVRETAAP